MSLVGYMIRRALVENLRGQTLADQSVYDSVIDPLDILASKQATPFICVSIEAGTDRGFTDRDIGQSETRERVITLDIGVGSAITVDAPGDAGGTQTIVTLATTDAGAELTLDLLTRQIHRAFTVPYNESWGAVLKAMVSHPIEVGMRRGLLAEDGQRAAFRQITISARVLAEPPHGKILPVWETAISALEANAQPAIAAQGAVIRAIILGEEIAPESMVWLRRGFAQQAAEAIQLTSFDGVPHETVLTDVEVGADLGDPS